MGLAPGDGLPLTGAQQGVWFAQALAPDNPIFNTADAVEITGPVDELVLATEIRRVLDGAEALHVRFADRPDGPAQHPRSERDWPLPILDLRGHRDPGAAAIAFMETDLQAPVSLARDRLFASALMRTGDAAWTWYLRIHHIATDAYATALLMRRVAERYTADADPDRPAPLHLGSLQSLVDADREYHRSDAPESDRRYWRERLHGHTAPATLATAIASERTAPARTLAAPTRATRHLDANLADPASAVGAGWPELLIAGVAANLQALTGAHRQVFAMPVLARRGPIRRTPGIAVNIVPLIVDVDPDQSLSDLVLTVRDELRMTRRHQQLRFEELARMLPAGTPLFGPQINLKPYASELRFGDATGHIRNLATGPVDDLSLIATDLPGGGLALTLDGNASRYDEAMVREQLDRFVVTLEACAEPGAIVRSVGSLPTITGAERRQVVARFNDTAHVVPRTTVAAQLRAQAAATPEHPAVSDALETITYGELHRRAEALAAELRTCGARPGTLVGLGLERSVGLAVAVTAVLLAGAAYLPIDPDLPADRLDYVLGHAQPACVIVGEAVVAVVPSFTAASCVLIDEGGHATTTPQPPAGPRSSNQETSLEATPPPPTPTDPAYVIYTSGSTGRPKGVVVEHAAIVNRLDWMQHLAPIGPGDTVLQKTPYGFDVSVWELTWPLLRGARLLMAEPGGHRDPAYLAALIQREHVSLVHFVPSMLDLFLDEPESSGCTALRHVVCSGEALPATTVDRYHERLSAPLHNLYGPTEAAIDVTAWTCDSGDPPGPIPIGRPIWNTRTYVLDEALRPLPIGAAGELWLAGANLAREYLGRPDLTADAFVHDPLHEEWAAATGVAPGSTAPRMYRTGDVARWRPDGALEYLGRTDDQVKLRGLRIELGEIETTLARHPLVARAAAAVDRAGASARLVAYVVLADEPPHSVAAEQSAAAGGRAPSGSQDEGAARLADRSVGDALLAHVAASLPEYMVPAAIAVLDDLPLSANGKLDRRKLPAVATPADGHTLASRLPFTPLEQTLCEVFADALGRPVPLGPDQNVFDLGGDSLLAARLATTIRARLGVPLTLGALFAAPTPSALADRIDAGGDLAALEPLLTLRAGGDLAPLFCVHPAGGVSWCYAGLGRTIQDRPILAFQAPGIRGEAMPDSIAELASGYADLLEARHPSGPCHLLGWSVGGVIAQAMAAELQARGRETGVVALLDAFPGEQWAERPPPSREDTLLALLHMGGLDASALADEPPSLRSVLATLRRAGSALANLGGGTFERMTDTVMATSQMMRSHRTVPTTGDLQFFLAGAPRTEDWLDASTWQAQATGALEIHVIDCTHPEMPRPVPLDQIGAAIASALRAREQRGASATPSAAGPHDGSVGAEPSAIAVRER